MSLVGSEICSLSFGFPIQGVSSQLPAPAKCLSPGCHAVAPIMDSNPLDPEAKINSSISQGILSATKR